MNDRTQKTLLMINMSFAYDWDHSIVNRNFHILQQARNSGEFAKIISVDFFPFTWKKQVKYLLRDQPWKKNEHTIEQGNTWTLETIEGNKNDIRARVLRLRDLPKVLEKIQVEDSEDLVVWSYNPLATDVFDFFPSATHVFDAVDNWLEHGSYAAMKPQLEEGYQRIREEADCIFTVSQAMVDFFGKRDNVLYIPNGVDVDFFANGRCTVPAISGLKGPVIGYHGNIQSRVNFALLEYLVDKHADFQFVLAGFIWKEVKAQVAHLAKKPNVTIITETPYEELPNIIACFDIAIIPHTIDQFTQSMNPLKLYEYIAAGKPVITTAVAGVEQFGDLVTLAVSPEDFSKGIEDVIQNDTVEQIERRMQAADAHRWEGRWALMQERLLEAMKHSQ